MEHLRNKYVLEKLKEYLFKKFPVNTRSAQVNQRNMRRIRQIHYAVMITLEDGTPLELTHTNCISVRYAENPKAEYLDNYVDELEHLIKDITTQYNRHSKRYENVNIH